MKEIYVIDQDGQLNILKGIVTDELIKIEDKFYAKIQIVDVDIKHVWRKS